MLLLGYLDTCFCLRVVPDRHQCDIVHAFFHNITSIAQDSQCTKTYRLGASQTASVTVFIQSPSTANPVNHSLTRCRALPACRQQSFNALSMPSLIHAMQPCPSQLRLYVARIATARLKIKSKPLRSASLSSISTVVQQQVQRET